ncbi:MAG: antitoxin Xre/MbcA/ParS toxin-binding domain-containing protein [Ginsengibacter sp.]
MAKNKKISKPYPLNEDGDKHSIVSEPEVALREEYQFDTMLADAIQRPARHLTAFEKMHIARDGVSKKDLELLKSKAELDYTTLAKALSVTRATLINKKRTEKFNSGLSEKIISMADLYSYGFEVFEDEGRFNQWMAQPNKALGGQTPYDLIDNQFGREEVKDLIGRIDYGIYS